MTSCHKVLSVENFELWGKWSHTISQRLWFYSLKLAKIRQMWRVLRIASSKLLVHNHCNCESLPHFEEVVETVLDLAEELALPLSVYLLFGIVLQKILLDFQFIFNFWVKIRNCAQVVVVNDIGLTFYCVSLSCPPFLVPNVYSLLVCRKASEIN